MQADPDRRDVSATRSQRRAWRKGLLAGGLALAFQCVILGLAVLIGVLDPQPHKEATLKLPAGSATRHREQQRTTENQLAQLNRMQSEGLNTLMQPMLEATRPELAVASPDLAQSIGAMGAMLPMGSIFQGSLSAFTDGMDADSLPPPDPVSFLGESLSARRIVLLLDVSGSVKSKMERAGVSMEKLREEVHKFVDQLGPNHLFGIIQFTRKWQAFRDELVPATTKVREEAREWINSSFRTNGTSGHNWNGGFPNGIEAVMTQAFAMDPQLDELFLVSDCDFQRTPPGGGGQDVPWAQLRDLTKQLQQQSIGETRLRVLCFYPPEEALADLKAWVRETGNGTLRVF
ncbi:hypothetical protein G0Q06_05570 [Puniceicoccales bacterium CK1056]|uniref:VWFA domain-containing protein n=1 Tax=Oceanipulchritudo coccoides TaxID=2706888 RepID=A0A6B2M0J5_9BACT|nr:hypothetical protein [Oceanipulchritudo coccoides]NDV61912.1 hypothetical protein [Oceanipulchritudo coccoides]